MVMGKVRKVEISYQSETILENGSKIALGK